MYAQERDDVAALLGQIQGGERMLRVVRLTSGEEEEVLSFLGQRPAHTFGLIGFVRSNGLESEHNRGTFYACRDENGGLDGVALIGHATLFEARSEAALAEFARLAQRHTDLYMLLGEQGELEVFWRHYSSDGLPARHHCTELLYDQGWPEEAAVQIAGLRLARAEDLHLIVPVHAQTVIAESGEDPLEKDAEGFRKRCARRVEKGSTWVLVEDGELVFKAEVVTDSPEVIYLEGVWVSPDRRGRGMAKRCLHQLVTQFLTRTRAVCLLVNKENTQAQRLYEGVGFRLVAHYDTIFLRQWEKV